MEHCDIHTTLQGAGLSRTAQRMAVLSALIHADIPLCARKSREDQLGLPDQQSHRVPHPRIVQNGGNHPGNPDGARRDLYEMACRHNPCILTSTAGSAATSPACRYGTTEAWLQRFRSTNESIESIVVNLSGVCPAAAPRKPDRTVEVIPWEGKRSAGCPFFFFSASWSFPARERHGHRTGQAGCCDDTLSLYDLRRMLPASGRRLAAASPGIEPHGFEPRPADIVRLNAAICSFTRALHGALGTGTDQRCTKRKTRGHPCRKGILPRESPRPSTSARAPDQGASGGPEAVDPHIWLDFANAVKMVETIRDGFIRKDPPQGNLREERRRLHGKAEGSRRAVPQRPAELREENHCQRRPFRLRLHGKALRVPVVSSTASRPMPSPRRQTWPESQRFSGKTAFGFSFMKN